MTTPEALDEAQEIPTRVWETILGNKTSYIQDRLRAFSALYSDAVGYSVAKCALAEYNDAYEQGGEIDYPFWAERIIRGYEENV